MPRALPPYSVRENQDLFPREEKMATRVVIDTTSSNQLSTYLDQVADTCVQDFKYSLEFCTENLSATPVYVNITLSDNPLTKRANPPIPEW